MMGYFLEPFRGKFNPLEHNLQIRHYHWLRNINLISIDYGFRPRLRYPTNSARINLAQKLDFRQKFFTSFIVTYISIRTSDTSGSFTDIPSQAYRTFHYQSQFSKNCKSTIRYMILAPLHLRRRNSIRPVSCYAIFKDGCF